MVRLFLKRISGFYREPVTGNESTPMPQRKSPVNYSTVRRKLRHSQILADLDGKPSAPERTDLLPEALGTINFAVWSRARGKIHNSRLQRSFLLFLPSSDLQALTRLNLSEVF